MSLIQRLAKRTIPYLAVAFLTGCGDWGGDGTEVREEQSEIMHEDAKVVDLVFSPSHHYSKSDIDVGMTSGGKLVFTPTNVTIEIKEKYGAVFECQHGKFISVGEDVRHKDLWKRLHRDDEVDVTYRELYQTTYRDTDGDGKKDIIEKKLVKYDFLDAQQKRIEVEKK